MIITVISWQAILFLIVAQVFFAYPGDQKGSLLGKPHKPGVFYILSKTVTLSKPFFKIIPKILSAC